MCTLHSDSSNDQDFTSKLTNFSSRRIFDHGNNKYDKMYLKVRSRERHISIRYFNSQVIYSLQIVLCYCFVLVGAITPAV